MRAIRSSLVVAAFLALALACGGGGGSTPATSPTSGGSATAVKGTLVPIAPLQLVLDKDGVVALEIRADGTIVGGKGESIAKFDGRKLVGTETGKGIMVADDGSIHPATGPVEGDDRLAFDANDDLVSTRGEKIAVSADGVPSFGDPSHGVTVLPARIKGITPETHRLAVLLVFVAMMAHDAKAAVAASSASAVVAPPPPPSASPIPK